MPPKIAVSVYRHDVKVKLNFAKFRPPEPGERENCRAWSKRSRKRLMFVAMNTDIEFRTMVTLTYPQAFPKDGKVVKKHLDLMLKWIKYHALQTNYLWFFEWQQRGAPHVHILLERSLRGLVAVDDISSAWYRICDSGDEKHLLAGTKTERLRKKNGAIRYALKYASKMRQKKVPADFINVGRMWGHSRAVKPMPKRQAGFANLPELQKALGTWPGLDEMDKKIWRTLYGASSYFKISHSHRDHEHGSKIVFDAEAVTESR
jgi:hypothetical protein